MFYSLGSRPLFSTKKSSAFCRALCVASSAFWAGVTAKWSSSSVFPTTLRPYANATAITLWAPTVSGRRAETLSLGRYGLLLLLPVTCAKLRKPIVQCVLIIRMSRMYFDIHERNPYFTTLIFMLFWHCFRHHQLLSLVSLSYATLFNVFLNVLLCVF